MSDFIKQVLKSDKKYKEKIAHIVEEVINNSGVVDSLIQILESGTDVEKSIAAEVM